MGGGDVLMSDYEECFRLLNERINQLEDELARFESKTGFMNAETMRDNARAWIVNNPKAWAYLNRNAVRAVATQSRFSIQQAIEQLRNDPSIMIDESTYRICNSYGAVLARELANELPQLRTLIKFGRSKVDRFYPWLKDLK